MSATLSSKMKGELFEAAVMAVLHQKLSNVTDNRSYSQLKQEFKNYNPGKHGVNLGQLETEETNFSHSARFVSLSKQIKSEYNMSKGSPAQEMYSAILSSAVSAANLLMAQIVPLLPADPTTINVTLDAVGGMAPLGDGLLKITGPDGTVIADHILEMKMYDDLTRGVTYHTTKDTSLFGSAYAFWKFLAASDKQTNDISSPLVTEKDFWNLQGPRGGKISGKKWAALVMGEAYTTYIKLLEKREGGAYELYKHLKEKAGRSVGNKKIIRGFQQTEGKTAIVFSMQALLDATKTDLNTMSFDRSERKDSSTFYFHLETESLEKLRIFQLAVQSGSKKFFEEASKKGYTRKSQVYLGLETSLPAAYFNYAMSKFN